MLNSNQQKPREFKVCASQTAESVIVTWMQFAVPIDRRWLGDRSARQVIEYQEEHQ